MSILSEMVLQSSAVPGPDDIQDGDVVVVLRHTCKYFGSLCLVQYAGERKTVEVLRIGSITFKSGHPEVEVHTTDTDFLLVKRAEVRRLAMPGMRLPPQPDSVFDLLALEWSQHSHKRFSHMRLRACWQTLAVGQRLKYRAEASSAKEAYGVLASRRRQAWSLAAEMLALAPKKALRAFNLFVRECADLPQTRRFAEAADRWKALSASEKEGFCKKAEALNADIRRAHELYIRVLCGAGWARELSQFFPASFNRHLCVVLLCQRQRDSTASKIPASIWKDHVFAFMPLSWFIRPDEEHGRPCNRHSRPRRIVPPRVPAFFKRLSRAPLSK